MSLIASAKEEDEPSKTTVHYSIRSSGRRRRRLWNIHHHHHHAHHTTTATIIYCWLFKAIALCMISTSFFFTIHSSSSYRHGAELLGYNDDESNLNLPPRFNNNITNKKTIAADKGNDYEISPTAITRKTGRATTNTTTSTSSSSSSSSTCFPYNSQAWLNGPRLGNNIQHFDENAFDDFHDDPFSFWKSNFQFLDETHNNNNNNMNDTIEMINRLLNNTICSNQSRLFLRDDNDINSNDDDNDTEALSSMSIRTWTTRLVYLATHVHQHEPALLEARHRQQLLQQDDDCLQEMQDYNIGPFDYECPTAKFLVVSLSDMGLGTNLRYGVVAALKAAMSIQRIALIINHYQPHHHHPNTTTTASAFKNRRLLSRPWALASCRYSTHNSRQDYQCFFAPPSPCTITHEQLDQASTLSTAEMRTVFRHGRLPQSYQNERVVIMTLKFRAQRHPTTLYQRLYDLSQQWISSSSMNSTVIQKAANRLLAMQQQQQQQQQQQNASSSLVSAAAANADAEITGGLLLYSMRPNPRAMRQIQEIVQDMLPPPKARADEEEKDWIVGLPIRASDKCDGESECMPFEHYIRAAEQLWIPHLVANSGGVNNHSSSRVPRTTTTIIVTTESSLVIQEQEAFMAKHDLQQDFAFPFRIVNNHYDVMQGTGFVLDALAASGAAAQATLLESNRRLENTTTTATSAIGIAVDKKSVVDADAIMLSTVSSLKAQLMANVVIGNCCSNFHQMLRELIEHGCGGGGGGHHTSSSSWTSSTFYCLQDHPNPDYRLCCSWDKSSRCMAKRQRQQRQQ